MSAANIAPTGADDEGSRRLLRQQAQAASRPASPFRDAGLSALVALGLFAPLIGLRTDAIPTGLVLVPRPVALAAFVALTFLGRLLLLVWRARRRPASAYAGNRRFAETLTRAGRVVAPLLLLAAVALPFSGSRYYLDLACWC